MHEFYPFGHTILHDLEGRVGRDSEDGQIDFTRDIAYTGIDFVAQNIFGGRMNRVDITLKILIKGPGDIAVAGIPAFSFFR